MNRAVPLPLLFFLLTAFAARPAVTQTRHDSLTAEQLSSAPPRAVVPTISASSSLQFSLLDYFDRSTLQQKPASHIPLYSLSNHHYDSVSTRSVVQTTPIVPEFNHTNDKCGHLLHAVLARLYDQPYDGERFFVITGSVAPGSGGLPKDGITMGTDDVLTNAEDFLGDGYKEVSPGRFVSEDGTNVVRMGDNDLLGKHGGGPHVNFETLKPNPGKMMIDKKAHVYYED